MSFCQRQDKEGPGQESPVEEQQGERRQPVSSGALAIETRKTAPVSSAKLGRQARAMCVGLTGSAE